MGNCNTPHPGAPSQRPLQINKSKRAIWVRGDKIPSETQSKGLI